MKVITILLQSKNIDNEKKDMTTIDAVITLNNNAVDLLLHGRCENSILVLARALKLLQRVLREKSNARIMRSNCHVWQQPPETVDGEGESPFQQSVSLSYSSSSLRPLEECKDLVFAQLSSRRGVVLDPTSKDPFNIYTDPILVDPEDTFLQDPSYMSIVLILNLALAYHHSAIGRVDPASPTTKCYFHKALQVYKIAFKTLTQDRRFVDAGSHAMYSMAVINNIASIYVSLGEKVKSIFYLQILQKHLMVIRERTQVMSSQRFTISRVQQKAFEAFRENTDVLILRNITAPAA
jgi:hypothetical protein